MAAKKNAVGNENIVPVDSFTKEQLISANKYAHQKDLLNILLREDKMYSFKEVDGLIEDFLKKEVS